MSDFRGYLARRVALVRSLRSEEQGAAAVLVALLGVLLMGFAALAIDYGHAESEGAKAQVAADAAALAIAEDCAAGRTAACRADGPGISLATLNGADSASGVVTASDRTVSVSASIVVDHWFAPIIGIRTSTMKGEAVARWTAPVTSGGGVVGASVIPFLMEECMVPTGYAPVRVTLRFSAFSASCEGFASPASQLVPVSDSCASISVSPGQVLADRGTPWFWSGCALPSTPIVVALWDDYQYLFFGQDEYRISSFAIFDPQPDRVNVSSVSGTFYPLDPNHPDIVRGVGATVPGSVSLIE